MGKIGDMDRSIELKSLTAGKSGMGGITKTYTHSFNCMASRENAGLSPEQYLNNRLITAPRFKYRIHVRSGITESMQLIDDSVKYNILSVDYPDNLFIEILAEKIVE
jgi:SPP1 family predicted phage head-tail adaptor